MLMRFREPAAFVDTNDFSASANLPMPTAFNTGPRVPITREITGSAARTEILNTGTLQPGTRVTSQLNYEAYDFRSVVVEDCEFRATAPYTLLGESYDHVGGTLADRPKFRFCRFIGAGAIDPSSTNVSTVAVFRYTVLDFCDLFGCADSAKISHQGELNACYLHDNWHNGLASSTNKNSHCDGVQIRIGDDAKVRWCNIRTRVAYSPNPDTVGQLGSGGLQTGSLQGNIRRFVWHDNWTDEAVGLLRMGETGYPTPNDDPTSTAFGYVIDSQFRRNKLGQQFGSAGRTEGGKTGANYQSSLGGERWDSSNVDMVTGESV